MHCASFELRMKFKTLFMSDEEKHGHHFDLPLYFNMIKQFLTPGGLSAECVQVSVKCHVNLGLQGAGSEAPKA